MTPLPNTINTTGAGVGATYNISGGDTAGLGLPQR